ncbi:Serine/threonine-protein kinase 24 [Thoreauomyces humboldtii]|nr:Serine/threonine-protein kinase 24 [Thoreauomyces humboldtii]
MSVSEKTRKVFAQYDRDKDGFWTETDFRDFLGSMGRGDIGESRTRASFNYLDTSKSGKITVAMFEKGINLLAEADFYFGKPKSDDDLSTVRLTVRNRRYPVVVKPDLSDPLLLYTLVEKVGEGSYGEIFKSVLKTDALKIVALKIIDLEKTQDDLDELLYEVDFQAKCFSPHLARYYGSWLWQNKLYIAMEYLGGGTACELIQHSKLSEEQCAYILREILKGLDYMHGENRIHRDIKAENILFDNWGALKLADFGVAAQIKAPASSRTTFVGTPLYMAPEIIKGDAYGCTVDIWSVGILAIELATGQPPRSNLHPMDILYATVKEDAPLLKGSKGSAQFQDFVKRCLTKDPEQRATAKVLLDHPFTQTDRGPAVLKERLDKYWVKRKEMAGAAARTVQQDDSWWQQYTQQSTVKGAPGAAPSGPIASAEAKASIRADLASINPLATYGKGTRHQLVLEGAMRPPSRAAGVVNIRGGNEGPKPTLPEAAARLKPAHNDVTSAGHALRPASGAAAGESTRPGVIRNAGSGPTVSPVANATGAAASRNILARGMMIQPAALMGGLPRLRTTGETTASGGKPAPEGELKRAATEGGRSAAAGVNKEAALAIEAALVRPRSATRPTGVPVLPLADSSQRGRLSSVERAEAERKSPTGPQPGMAIEKSVLADGLSRLRSTSAGVDSSSTASGKVPEPSPSTTSAPKLQRAPSRGGASDSDSPRQASSISVPAPSLTAPFIVSTASRPSTPTLLSPAETSPSKRTSMASSAGGTVAENRHSRDGSIDDSTRFRPPLSALAPPKYTKATRTQAQNVILDLSDTFQKLLSDPLFIDVILPGEFLKSLDELYLSELQYMEILVSLMEVYVRPLMGSLQGRSAVLKEESVKTIFAALSPLHAFSMQLQAAIISALEATSPDGNGKLVENITGTLEELVVPMEQLYTMYAEQFCAAICEMYHGFRESSKFREFAVAAEQSKQCGFRSLFDLLRAPFSRVIQYANAFEALAESGNDLGFANAARRIVDLSSQMNNTVYNAQRLLGMLVQITGIPPAMITKRGQQLIMDEGVDKVKLNSQGGVATRSPIRLYVLKDAWVITKVLKEPHEEVDVRELLNPSNKAKPPKQNLQYRDLQLREFVKAEPCGGRDGERGTSMFSVEVTLKKGKLYVFSADSVDARDRWISSLNPTTEGSER